MRRREMFRAMLAGAGAFAGLRQANASMGMMLTDLLPGFASADAGDVVKLAELQSQG